MTLVQEPPRRWLARADATTALTLYLVLLLVIPSPMVLTALGQIGGPATLVALAAFAGFVLSWLLGPRDPLPGGRGVRNAALLFLLVFVTVYAHSNWLPLPIAERSPGDASLLRFIGFIGLVCLASTHINSRERLWKLVERFVLVIGAITVLAVAQMITGQQYVDRLSIPGLAGTIPDYMAVRGVLTRPSGTATHPIEYAAVLSMALPFTLALLAHGTTRPRLFRAIAALSVVVLLMTGSRTAIVCGVVVFAAMLPTWSRRTQLLSLVGGIAMVPVFFVAVPGFLGTMKGLFTGGSSDSSIVSRTNSYAIVGEYTGHHPWLGRGMGTFLSSYWIFDNQYLGLLVGAGVIGLLAMFALVWVAVASASRARRLLRAEDDRQLAAAARASALAGALALATFDAFSFAQAVGVFFFVIGMCGAVRRLADQLPESQPVREQGAWTTGHDLVA